ncbi:nuclear protein MDM1 isoform X3 [Perognathus longimembris pacificus]|uniref:nuclear protein MDM1 isoform X3 n=1 Tax=Perognathus longimembris pacificus TaxID=214514 RepID=UPI002018B835|nr:nuclear protein MDM1 isoform X3 [Perognathus longimembris pacificus]
MPVRFKGLSEYQRNFLWKKSYLAESYNPSVGRRYPWAGLRSDQIGITKEPSFISKRRVPYHDPQISKSLEWNGAVSENHAVVPPEPEAPGVPNSQEVEQKEVVNQERVLSLEASRVPKRTRSHSADSRAGGASDVVEKNEDIITDHIAVNKTGELDNSTKLPPENVENGVDRLLRKKAGLTIAPSHNALRNSEYQRQFVWKTSKVTTPVFAANQVFYNKSKFVPQLKDNTVVHETEYKRNFKGLSPVKESKLNDLKENGNLETESPEKKSNKMDDPVTLESEMASKVSNKPEKTVTPWRHQRLGKVNSEYRAKFLSPAQYLYKAGTWTRVKENMPSQVKELREKAEFYRKRVQGTHFSRDHLNQILSDNNRCWDVSSTTSSEGTVSSNIRALDLARDPTSHKTLQKNSEERNRKKPEEKRAILEEQLQQNATEKLDLSNAPTMPVGGRLAWNAESTNEDGQKQLSRQPEEEPGKDKQMCMGELEKLDVPEKSEAHKIKEGSDISSVSSSGKGGRLPTPKLRELGGIQRTHHDLTTPAVGGAVLVSPSKGKPPFPEQRKRMFCQDGLETSKNVFTKKGSHAKSRLTSPTAGIKTVDPLPLREDLESTNPKFTEATLPVSNIPEYSANTPGQSPSPPQAASYWHPSRRIQGSLRHPEFQHNVGKAGVNNFQLPPHEDFHNEDEDRLSEISARSVATSLRAFQTLARAQKRKESFWGKT